MQRPRTIKAALLAGFLVIFAVWLGSTFYFTERLARAQAQSAAIHARFAPRAGTAFRASEPGAPCIDLRVTGSDPGDHL
jgi:hypothetical protein